MANLEFCGGCCILWGWQVPSNMNFILHILRHGYFKACSIYTHFLLENRQYQAVHGFVGAMAFALPSLVTFDAFSGLRYF
jgi:hypothetical protein